MNADRPITVSLLTSAIKEILEVGFPRVWVEGELSNIARPASGHLYFTLRDSQAQLKCVMYRSSVLRSDVALKDGLAVEARGKIGLYPPSGQYQLIVESLRPKGIGSQELQLRQLKEKLARLGYFQAGRKRNLPPFPKTIGIVTSPSGAAIRDMLEVFRSRWPYLQILLFPARVQGETAAAEIKAAIHFANDVHEYRGPIDVLIVGRGGGSSEDLSAFNNETVAKAIFESEIPVISAVGHEIDVSIADMVADVRALTPTQAAVLCTPDRNEILAGLEAARNRLRERLRRKAETTRLRLQVLAGHPLFRSPLDGIRDRERRLDEFGERLLRKMRERTSEHRAMMNTLAARLESLSPLKVLGRGYSLTQVWESGRIATAASLQVGDRIRTRFADGEAISRVEEVRTL